MTTEETLVQCQYCSKQYTPNPLTKVQDITGSDYTAESLCTHCRKQNVHNFYEGLSQPEYENEEEERYALMEQKDYDNAFEDDGNQDYMLPVQPPPEKSQKFRHTDVGNAKRLVSFFGQDIRYSGGGWYYWNGRHWQKDTDGLMMRLAKKTAGSIFEEAELAPESERKELLKFAHKTENDSKLRAMIKQVVSEEGITIPQDTFDANPWLLNTQNGTVNLLNGRMFLHYREHFIKKIIPVVFTPGAECPIWMNFLNRIMDGNQNLISFLQRAVGYTLTGDTSEQCLFFLWGTGANGKSTFLEIIRELMGDYAQQTDFDTFLKTQNTIRNDLARLQGARYVSGVEAEAGKQFAETLIKRVTGEDKITARFLYKEYEEFTPSFKIFLGANYKPTIKGTDHAIWRRVHLIPFTVRIPPKERDKKLKDRLQQELSGILNWALQGCFEWQKNGLQPPEEVTMATAEYRAEMDVLVDFLEDYCEVKQGVSVLKIDLYNAYVNWCQQNSEEPIKINPFGTKMIEKGFNPKDKSGNVRIWKGIQLKQ